jgi:hypothetical protein
MLYFWFADSQLPGVRKRILWIPSQINYKLHNLIKIYKKKKKKFCMQKMLYITESSVLIAMNMMSQLTNFTPRI